MTDTTNTRLIHTLPHGDFPEIAHVESAVILFPNGTLSGNWKSRPNDRTCPYIPLEDHERIVAKAVQAALERAADLLERADFLVGGDDIRSLASDPAERAAIIKSAGEDRG